MKAAAGVYVHLRTAVTVRYCAFVVSTDDSSRDDYLAALVREAAIWSRSGGVPLRLAVPGRRHALPRPADTSRGWSASSDRGSRSRTDRRSRSKRTPRT